MNKRNGNKFRSFDVITMYVHDGLATSSGVRRPTQLSSSVRSFDRARLLPHATAQYVFPQLDAAVPCVRGRAQVETGYHPVHELR